MPAAPDELDYGRAAWRIGRNMAIIAATGTAIAFVTLGWKWGAGFLLGAGLSAINFRWLRRLLDALGGQRQSRGRWWTIALRYLLLGLAAYAIVRCFPISPPAVVAGLFVLTAAVFVETIFEIVYARK